MNQYIKNKEQSTITTGNGNLATEALLENSDVKRIRGCQKKHQ